MTDSYIHGHIAQDSIFWGVFPENIVPLISPIPFFPDAPGAPLSYSVDVSKLDESVIEKVAEITLKHGESTGEMPRDTNQAIQCMRATGFAIEVRNCPIVAFGSTSERLDFEAEPLTVELSKSESRLCWEDDEYELN